MKDCKGIEIRLGDEVAYAVRSGGVAMLRIGVVESVESDQITMRCGRRSMRVKDADRVVVTLCCELLACTDEG